MKADKSKAQKNLKAEKTGFKVYSPQYFIK
jgi:hypothetical protein